MLDEIRERLATKTIGQLVEPIGTLAPSVQELILKLTNSLAQHSDDIRYKIANLTILPHIIPLLVNDVESLQDATAACVAFLTNTDPTGKNRSELCEYSGLQNLMKALSTEQLPVKENVLISLKNFVEWSGKPAVPVFYNRLISKQRTTL